MKDLPFEQVLGALLVLGCRVARETDLVMTIVRGAAIIQHLPRTPMVPLAIQRRVLHAFSIAEDDFLRAIERRN